MTRRQHGRTHRRRRAAAIATLAALGIAACGSDDSATSATRDAVEADSPSNPPSDLAIGGGAPEDPGVVEPATTVPATGGATLTALPFDDTFGRDLIIEMGLTMSTSNVQATLEDVRRLTRSSGGAVFSADVNVGEQLEDGSVTGGGTLVIRIPPDLLDGLVQQLSGVARISNVTQDTQDVSEQLVDLEIRIRQARTGIAQIEVLYGQATEFEDLIEIEQELARRQVDLERLLAAQRGVEGRVALSKLTVTISYEPIAADEVAADEVVEDDGIGDAFRDGWDAFAGALFAVGFVLAISAPFLILALAVLLAGWLITRRRPNRRRLPAPAPAPEPVKPAVDDELVGASHED